MVKTTAGPMRLERVRDASKLGFESKVLGKGVARMHALESLVIGGFLRGCRQAMSRRRSRGGLRGANRVQEHGLQDLRGHPRELPAVVHPAPGGGARHRLPFLDAIYLKLHPETLLRRASRCAGA
jgi:hypothetical protein